MLLDMALVRAVDALDIYIRYSIRKPLLSQSSTLRTEIDKANQSISGKFAALERHYVGLNEVVRALVALMISWRNRAAHSLDNTELGQAYKDIISKSADDIADRFSGLSVVPLLLGFQEARPPHFKEIASLISATHHYVAELERVQFESLDAETFLKELIWKALLQEKDENETAEQCRSRRLKSIWGRDIVGRRRYVDSFLRHHGISQIETTETKSRVEFSDALLGCLYSRTPAAILEWITPAVNDPLPETDSS
jgi:hypothetical protein